MQCFHYPAHPSCNVVRFMHLVPKQDVCTETCLRKLRKRQLAESLVGSPPMKPAGRIRSSKSVMCFLNCRSFVSFCLTRPYVPPARCPSHGDSSTHPCPQVTANTSPEDRQRARKAAAEKINGIIDSGLPCQKYLVAQRGFNFMASVPQHMKGVFKDPTYRYANVCNVYSRGRNTYMWSEYVYACVCRCGFVEVDEFVCVICM